MELLKISADEFQSDIGRYQDIALRQPVAVSRDGCQRTVLISEDEYVRLKRRDRDVLGLDDFTLADIKALESSRPPLEAAVFDHELKP